MAVSLPALHREGPICPVVPLRTPAEFPPGPQFQPGPAQRRVHGCARPQSTSQCTGEPGIPANSTLSGQANMYPVCEATLPLITSPYSIKSFVLIIFTRHWAHLPLLPSISFLVSQSVSLPVVVPVHTQYYVLRKSPSHLVPLCRENAVKLPSAGPPQGCETRQRRTHQSPHHRPRDPIESRMGVQSAQYTQILAHNLPHMARRICPRLVLPGPPFRELSFGCHRVTQ